MNQREQVAVSLQLSAHAGSSLVDFYTLKVEAILSSETLANKISTRCHFPEDGILHSHRRENLKSHKMQSHLILKQMLHTVTAVLHEDWIDLAQDWNQWRDLVSIFMNYPAP
jgi:YD repeat-containing protein